MIINLKTMVTLANNLPLWKPLSGLVFKEDETMGRQTVAAHIAAYSVDKPLVYTSHLVRYATQTSSGDVVGCLTPTQVIPVWHCEKVKKARGWSQITALQQFLWAAVAYEGKLYAADTDGDKQNFTPGDFLAGATMTQANSRLMTPGGRVQHNMQTPFPWAVPLKNHPTYSNKVRIASPMTLGSWTSLFGNAQVVAGEFPPLQLVAYDDKGDLSLYDPVQAMDVKARVLGNLPISMDYLENSMRINEPTLFEKIQRSVLDYMSSEGGDPSLVGITWGAGLSVDGEDLAVNFVEGSPTTAQAVYVQDFDDVDFTSSWRLQSEEKLAMFVSGAYAP
jgi:hypothetical protein